MKKLTKLSLLALISMLTFSISSCTKDLEDRLDKVEGDVAKLATSLTDLSTKLDGITYIKTITVAADGKMTITPSTGTPIIYDAKSYITQSAYEIKFEGNKLFVKGPGDTDFMEKGSVDFPELPVATPPTLSLENGELKINGKSQTPPVMITHPSPIVFVKDADGNITSVTMKDGSGAEVTMKITDMSNITNEPLSSMLFIPAIIESGYNAIDQGYINSIEAADLLLKSSFNTQKVNFRVNPTSANVAETAWKFVNNQAKFRVSRASTNGDLYTLYTAPKSAQPMSELGSYSFDLAIAKWEETTADDMSHLIALEGTNKDGFNNATNALVVSDYVKVVPAQFVAFVSHKIAKPAATQYEDYSNTLAVAKALAVVDHQIVFDATKKTNLNDLVVATANPGAADNKATRKTLEEYAFNGYTFKFTNIHWNGKDNVTDQAAFINVEENGDITVLQTTASIDRTPIVQVDVISSYNGKIIAQGFIKFEIVKKKAVQAEYTHIVDVTATPYPYASLFLGKNDSNTPGKPLDSNKTFISIDWVEMNHIYEALGVSHNEFRAIYNITPEVAFDNSEKTSNPTSRIRFSEEAESIDTYAMQHIVTPYAKFGTNTVTYTFTPNTTEHSKLIVIFKYNVVEPVLPLEILEGYRYNADPKTALVKGMNVNGAYKMEACLGEAFSHGSVDFRAIFGTATLGKIDGATHQFLLNDTYNTANTPTFDGQDRTLPETGSAKGTIDETFGTPTVKGILIGLKDKLVTAERTYKMNLRTNYVNGATSDFLYNVRFENPLTLVLATGASFSLEDIRNAQTFERDTKLNYVVKFSGLTMVNKGANSTVNSATTVKASDYVDITNVALGLFYSLVPTTEYHTVAKKDASAKDGVITWTNGGNVITTNVFGGKVTVKYVTSFAEITRTDDLTIVPGVVGN